MWFIHGQSPDLCPTRSKKIKVHTPFEQSHERCQMAQGEFDLKQKKWTVIGKKVDGYR